MDIQSVEEANNLLSNGILVQTTKGLVCLSLSDAISSGLNLSREDLQNLASELLLQQETKKATAKDKPLISVQSVQAINSSFTFSDGLGDSDGFTSESSDFNLLPSTSTGIQMPALVPLKKPGGDYASLALDNQSVELTRDVEGFVSSNVSDSDASCIMLATKPTEKDKLDVKEVNLLDTCKAVSQTVKKRGGWPKGRKRKPELLHLPPKAPSTGYNLYLNEQRLLFKNSNLPFHEITKLIGNKWSSLSLGIKKPYLERAEEEKKRYREELREYRQSSAYQLYLANKRRNRAKYNVLSESDMDATDDLDDEDNEELYCRTCDQYFHNLHNKREHLQGRQHMQMLAGAINSDSFNASLDESSLDCASTSKPEKKSPSDVTETINQVITAVCKRESDIKQQQRAIKEKSALNTALSQQLAQLKEHETKLKRELMLLKDNESNLEQLVMNLWQVPSWFVINDGNSTLKTT